MLPEQIAVKKEAVDDNMLKMIRELRYQNTEHSNRLADELERKAKIILDNNQAV